MSATAEGHWLDRLAVRLTRRQSLKAAVGGALALPLLKAAAPARAASGDDCYKGCMWTTHQEQGADNGRCGLIANGKFDAQIVLASVHARLQLLSPQPRRPVRVLLQVRR